MNGLAGLIERAAPPGAVIDFLARRFDVVSRPHVPSVPYHLSFRAFDADVRCRLEVLAGLSRSGRWFYDVRPGERAH